MTTQPGGVYIDQNNLKKQSQFIGPQGQVVDRDNGLGWLRRAKAAAQNAPIPKKDDDE